jgi:hypothetical protein
MAQSERAKNGKEFSAEIIIKDGKAALKFPPRKG